MAYIQAKRAIQAEELDQLLPLVVEIMPGQAAEGLIDIFEPGSFEGKSLRKLVETTLSKGDWSIEERQILEDVRKQLRGGKLLWKGQEIDGPAQDYAVREQTETGEKYLYVPVRAVKPQEGGAGVLVPAASRSFA